MSLSPKSPSNSAFLTGRRKSQAAVEFALTFPIFLMVIFGIIDFSLLLSSWLTLQNMTRQAVRYAATYQYNKAYCVDQDSTGAGCDEGPKKEAEIDAARLKSIRDEADRYRFIMMVDNAAAWNARGYLHLTICSARDRDNNGTGDYLVVYPVQGRTDSAAYASCKLDGVDTEDPGGQNNYVIVMADYNHPFLTPFINYTWPLFHLTSMRQAVVESFRISRVISLPPAVLVPTLTPSHTPTPTATSTVTQTPTPTNTPLPIVIQLINPVNSDDVVADDTFTRFEATAYNPPYGSTNGAGIQKITFWFDGPTAIPGKVETVKNYCAFGGDSPCNTFETGTGLDFHSLAPGLYTIYAQATGVDGRTSVIVSKSFYILATATPTASPTATKTRTPTITPTPDCADMSLGQWSSPSSLRLQIGVTNATGLDTTLTSVSFNWSSYKAINSTQQLKQWSFGAFGSGTLNTSDDTYSWSSASGPTATGGATPKTTTFTFDFRNADSNWSSINPVMFGLTVSFSNNCTLTYSPQSTPTPTVTRTSTPTRTNTATNTITPTRTITRTPTISRTPTTSLTPSNTPTITKTPTITLTSTKTLTPTVTLTFTKTKTPTITLTFTNTPTRTNTATRTLTTTVTLTRTATATGTRTATPTFTKLPPTNTPTKTRTPTTTPTPTDSEIG